MWKRTDFAFGAKHIHHLLLVYFGSVDLSFLDMCASVVLPHPVIIKDHFSHQHHQLMQILPLLQHEVPGVAGHWHKHIHVLSRLKDEEEEEESSEILSLNKIYNQTNSNS